MELASDPLRARLSSVAVLSSEHLEAVGRLEWLGLPRIVQPHVILAEENEAAASIFVVRRGWAFASKLLPNGSRQVVDFFVPGDVIGSGGIFLRSAQQSCETITETVLTEIPIDALKRASRQAPVLLEVLLMSLARDCAELCERMVDLGRRESIARVAHLLLELWRRLYVVGVATPTGYPCPLSQYLIADATGLTAIHVNRVLRELRETGLLTFRHGYVKFHDFGRLVDLTGFDQPSIRAKPFRARRNTEHKGAA
jgi:CRP-like cAMP-binding protein